MKRKFLSLIVAMVMVFGIITPPRGNVAYAAGETAQSATGDSIKADKNLTSDRSAASVQVVQDGMQIPLEGDILIGDETEHDKVYTTHKDATLSFTGALDVRPIKQQLASIETGHPGASGQEDEIAISNLNFSMIATFTLPDQMDFDPAEVKATLDGANDKFEITDTKTVGRTVTVTMTLKDQDEKGKYATFKDIKDAVVNTGDFLKVTLSGAKFNDTSNSRTNYIVKGTIGGNFNATATMNGNTVPFNFIFVGHQSDAGKDYTIVNQTDNNSIQFTLNYIPEIKATLPLEGDILIGDETEHTKVYETGKDVVQKFSGTLNVQPIKDKLKEVESEYSKNSVQGNDIAISNLDFSMIATFELPKEMDFDPAKVTATLADANDKFEITDTKTDGRKVTVTMKLKDQGEKGKYTTFEDIKTAVNGTGDVLKVTLSGAKFNKDSKPNTKYTVKGTIGGNFKATATLYGTSFDFRFLFEGLQSKEGKDFVIVNEANNTAIQFTLKYKEEKTPSTPSTPGWTVTPINPTDSKLDLVNHLAYMKGYPDLTFGPDRNMTRAEVTMMFARLLKNRPEANKVYAMPYSDVTKADWYAYAVSYMTENKLIMGYPDGTFRPNNPISRAEFAAIASRFDQLKPGLSLPFNDVAKGHWAYDVIASAADKGWVNGYPDGSFKPENKITRAEVVSTTNRMLNRYADLAFAKAHKNELAPMRDMDESHWAYGAAVEAMNGHDYHRQADGKNETWILLNGKRFTFPMAPTGIPN